MHHFITAGATNPSLAGENASWRPNAAPQLAVAPRQRAPRRHYQRAGAAPSPFFSSIPAAAAALPCSVVSLQAAPNARTMLATVQRTLAGATRLAGRALMSTSAAGQQQGRPPPRRRHASRPASAQRGASRIAERWVLGENGLENCSCSCWLASAVRAAARLLATAHQASLHRRFFPPFLPPFNCLSCRLRRFDFGRPKTAGFNSNPAPTGQAAHGHFSHATHASNFVLGGGH